MIRISSNIESKLSFLKSISILIYEFKYILKLFNKGIWASIKTKCRIRIDYITPKLCMKIKIIKFLLAIYKLSKGFLQLNQVNLSRFLIKIKIIWIKTESL